jgi:hypothetical protein
LRAKVGRPFFCLVLLDRNLAANSTICERIDLGQGMRFRRALASSQVGVTIAGGRPADGWPISVERSRVSK